METYAVCWIFYSTSTSKCLAHALHNSSDNFEWTFTCSFGRLPFTGSAWGLPVSFATVWLLLINVMKHILRLVNYCKKNYCFNTTNIFTVTFRSLSETFIRRSCSIIRLPVLATIVMRRGKKSVVRVAQRVAPLVPVQRLPSFFSNMYCLFDPSGTFVGFSVQNTDQVQ